VVLGEFLTDFIVEGTLILEIQACRSLADEHTAQLLGYLRAARFRHGLLINFGASKLQMRKLIL
jgi:GxxExxY protein